MRDEACRAGWNEKGILFDCVFGKRSMVFIVEKIVSSFLSEVKLLGVSVVSVDSLKRIVYVFFSWKNSDAEE